MLEPVYEDLDADGRPNFEQEKSMERHARLPKTPLQVKALQATHRTYFESSRQHKQFRGLEALSIGADPESRLFKAWMLDRIELIGKIRGATLENLIKSFENQVKYDAWKGRNRERVLSKPVVENVRSTMQKRMQELMEKK